MQWDRSMTRAVKGLRRLALDEQMPDGTGELLNRFGLSINIGSASALL